MGFVHVLQTKTVCFVQVLCLHLPCAQRFPLPFFLTIFLTVGRRSPRHATILLVVNELVRESSKELEAARRPVVCAVDLLKKKLGVDANDAEDTEVGPLVPMFGAEIAVQPQLVGS